MFVGWKRAVLIATVLMVIGIAGACGDATGHHGSLQAAMLLELIILIAALLWARGHDRRP